MSTRVLHLAGSAVSPFLDDLSRLYARDALAMARRHAGHETHVAHVSPDGTWRFPDDLGDDAIAAAASLPLADAVARIAALDLDAALPQMFCVPGMTHHRALLDLLGVPYVGNAPDVMALTADKPRAKAVVAAAGVRVPRGETLRPGDRPSIGTPAVVKPAAADNSSGITYVPDAAGFGAALDAAFAHGGEALVEEYVPLGREVRCGTVVRNGRVSCLPLEEYAPADVRTAADKVARGDDGALRLVAKGAERAWIVDADDPVVPAVHEAALRSHAALGCRHYGLFDFRIDPDGRPWFLEAGLYCSFSSQSVLAVMAAADGVPTDELYRRALDECRRTPD